MRPRNVASIVSDYGSVLLSAVLSRTILVGAIVVMMKFAWEGSLLLTTALLVPFLVFVYLSIGDAIGERTASME